MRLATSIFMSLLVAGGCMAQSQIPTTRPGFVSNAGLDNALTQAITNTGAFFDSLVNLLATDTVYKATTTNYSRPTPRVEDITEQSRKLLLSYIDFHFLPRASVALSKLHSNAACAAVGFDSFGYNIEVETLSREFTVYKCKGVIAGFCLEPVVDLFRADVELNKDSLQKYTIPMETISTTDNTWRSIMTTGTVFSPLFEHPQLPAEFSGDFLFTIRTKGMFDDIVVSLQRRIVATNQGSITDECIEDVVRPTEIAREVIDCKSENLRIVQKERDICEENIEVCSDFLDALCDAILEHVIAPKFNEHGEDICGSIHDELPKCLDAI